MDALVDMLIEQGTLRSPEIINAFRSIDRADFVPAESKPYAHMDKPIHIGYQQTISQPTTVAFMLELLGPHRGERILDIGSGSGWTTALLGHIVGSDGYVLGLERIEELVAFGKATTAIYDMPRIEIKKAGATLGDQKSAPFDHILVSASAREFPKELLSQVREKGTIVLPVRDAIWRIKRVNHEPLIEKYDGYIFVPLIK